MIHLVDHRNIAIYADGTTNVGRYIHEDRTPAGADIFGGPEHAFVQTDRTFHILKLGAPNTVAECLRVTPLERALALGATADGQCESLPAQAWLCMTVEPDADTTARSARTSSQLWIAALERSVKGADRTVATVMDAWRYAMARRAGLPWRKVADLQGNLIAAAIDANPALVHRLASRFGLPLPCAYHVDEADMAAWGSLGRVEQEFDKLQRLTSGRAAGHQPPLGADRG